MAASLMNRAVSRTETFFAFRLSLNLLRNFSTPAAASPATENPNSDPIKPKRRKNKKNLIVGGLRAAEAPKKISGVHKRCWKYIPNLSKTTPATAAQLQAA